MDIFWLLAFIGLAIGGSVWLRVWCLRRKFNNLPALEQYKPSPLSLAVQDLIGTAGGVYLSLVMLISFLKINIPDKTELYSVSFDPTALIAVVLAIIQPLASEVGSYFKKQG